MNRQLFFASVMVLAFSVNAVDLQSNIEQAHGQGRNEKQYFADMDASFAAKWNLILPAIEDYRFTKQRLKTICDVGTGTGLLAARLADYYRGNEVKVIGTDIMRDYVALAQRTFSLPNLRFRHRSTDETCFSMHNREKPGADIVVLSSVLHEAYSYGGNGDSDETLTRAISNAYASLRQGGRMLIRDFVAPDESIRNDFIILHHVNADIKKTTLYGKPRPLTCSNFAQDFRVIKNKAQTTRSDIFCQEIDECPAGVSCYLTNLATAYEFLHRKDFDDSYEAELNERYGFMSAKKAKNLIDAAGFHLVSLQTFQNEWIKRQRLQGKIYLYDIAGHPIALPDYQMFVVAEK